MDRAWRKRIQAAAAASFSLAALFIPSASFGADTAPFTVEDRLLVVAPQPDGEVLALGRHLAEAKRAGASVRVVYLTYGEAEGRSILSYKRRPALSRSAVIKKGRAAKASIEKAMAGFGLGPSEVSFLGYPDGGLMSLWLKHWGKIKPYRSLLTRINRVPFKEEPTYGHLFRGEELLKDLTLVLLETAPTRIFVTSPADPDADHQAAQLFLNTALFDAAQRAPVEPSITAFRAGKELPQGILKVEAVKKEVILKDTRRIVDSFLMDRIAHRVIGEELWTSVPLPAAFDEMGVLSVHLFGYKEGAAFGAMPKFTFRLYGRKLFVYERGRSFHDRRVAYSIQDGRLLVRLPLALLKEPHYVFASARTAKKAPWPDLGSWKLLEIA